MFIISARVAYLIVIFFLVALTTVLYFQQEKYLTPSSLTVLRSKNDFVEVTGECLDTAIFEGGIRSKMCLLPEETYISTMIKEEGAFEQQMVNSILKVMNLYKDATLIDCGSNVGMVSTVVAAAGRKVVAIDPLVQHLSYLRKGLSMLGNENNVRLLNNAVGNEPGLLYPHAIDKNNKAGTQMHTEEHLRNMNWQPDGPPVKVVTLMEVLSTVKTPTVILKVDVEGFECRAVTKDVLEGKSGHKIPFISMEWMHVRLVPEYVECVDILLNAGYVPYNYNFDVPWTREGIMALQNFPTVTDLDHDIVWLNGSLDAFKLSQ